jgi:hypothetical protein
MSSGRYRAMFTGPHQCCFPAMVVDATLPPDRRAVMCECVSLEIAEQIALNRTAMA